MKEEAGEKEDATVVVSQWLVCGGDSCSMS